MLCCVMLCYVVLCYVMLCMLCMVCILCKLCMVCMVCNGMYVMYAMYIKYVYIYIYIYTVYIYICIYCVYIYIYIYVRICNPSYFSIQWSGLHSSCLLMKSWDLLSSYGAGLIVAHRFAEWSEGTWLRNCESVSQNKDHEISWMLGFTPLYQKL